MFGAYCDHVSLPLTHLFNISAMTWGSCSLPSGDRLSAEASSALRVTAIQHRTNIWTVSQDKNNLNTLPSVTEWNMQQAPVPYRTQKKSERTDNWVWSGCSLLLSEDNDEADSPRSLGNEGKFNKLLSYLNCTSSWVSLGKSKSYQSITQRLNSEWKQRLFREFRINETVGFDFDPVRHVKPVWLSDQQTLQNSRTTVHVWWSEGTTKLMSVQCKTRRVCVLLTSKRQVKAITSNQINQIVKTATATDV